MVTNNNSLPKLPSLPKIRTRVACACGCGTLCGNRFAPGHDAKLVGYVKRINAGVWAPGGDLVDQFRAMAEWHLGCAMATADHMGLDWDVLMASLEDATGTEG